MRLAVLGLLGLALACGGQPPSPDPTPAPKPAPVRPAPPSRVVKETVTVQDPELEQRVSQLELQLLEKNARIDELQSRLSDAQQEVVRAMAKLQSFASRAEAASGMAEAEIAVEAMENRGASSDVAQAQRLLQSSTEAFNRGNYGGALYLANQAKVLAGAGQSPALGESTLRTGETLFTRPVPLTVRTRSNVRAGPGTGFGIEFTLDEDTPVTGYSHTQDWVRVSDQQGRSGWIARTLLVGRSDSLP